MFFLPNKKWLWNENKKPWNDDLGNSLRFLWLDSADDTRNSETQHSEALHFCRPGNYEVWKGHHYQANQEFQ